MVLANAKSFHRKKLIQTKTTIYFYSPSVSHLIFRHFHTTSCAHRYDRLYVYVSECEGAFSRKTECKYIWEMSETKEYESSEWGAEELN